VRIEGEPTPVEDVRRPRALLERAVIRARLDEADGAAGILAEPAGEHTAGRPAARNDHVVVTCVANHHCWYNVSMSDSVDKAKDVVHAVEHPVETAKALEHEAEEGKSARTPLIVISGITLFLLVIFVILLAIALTLYFVYGGK